MPRVTSISCHMSCP